MTDKPISDAANVLRLNCGCGFAVVGPRVILDVKAGMDMKRVKDRNGIRKIRVKSMNNSNFFLQMNAQDFIKWTQKISFI